MIPLLRVLLPVIALALPCALAAEDATAPTMVADEATSAAPASATDPAPSATAASATDAAAATPAAPPYSPAEIRAFLVRAETDHLADDPYWLTLMHASPGIGSRVDDPAFFLVARGKHDLRAELRADLAAFFAPAPADPATAPAARFPARLEWLCEKLGIDRARLPVSGSAEFEETMQSFGPRAAALVFPSAFMNQPASMFGHTLLMIRSRYKSALLSQAVNYAAVTREHNGVVFAFKGIFGLYPGFYSLMPYYQKVQEYNDLDQRDIWEYDLDFNPREIRRMLLHVWEMRGIWSDYYFFDENCSYNLLFLLDAARPGLDLHDQTGSWVIPLDTVKLVERSGLVTGRTWRPSRLTRVRARADRLDPAAREIAWELGQGTATASAVAGSVPDPAAQARVFDLAADYLQSLRSRRTVAQADYQRRLLPILALRSKLAAPADPDPPAPAPPDAGHGSGRLGLSGGVRGDDAYGALTIRAAYHDLLDPPAGYLTGAQIAFADTEARWYQHADTPVLERIDAISLRSISPWDRFSHPKTWAIDTGLEREVFADGVHYRAYLEGGAGIATSWQGGLAWALLDAKILAGPHRPELAAGIGPQVNATWQATDRWRLGPHADAHWYPGTPLRRHVLWDVGLGSRYDLSHSFSLRLDADRRQGFDRVENEAALGGLYYF
jgi:hypothetical protein